MSLDEVASLVESSNDRDDSNPLMERMSAINPSFTGPRILTTSSIDDASLVTANSEQYEDAVEGFPGQADLDAPTSVPRVTFAASTKVSEVSRQVPEDVSGIDKRLQQLTYSNPITPQHLPLSSFPRCISPRCELTGNSKRRQDGPDYRPISFMWDPLA